MADTVWLFSQIPNSKMKALTAILVFCLLTISSCLSLTPPIQKSKRPKKENNKQNAYSLPRKRVIWRNSDAGGDSAQSEHNALDSSANDVKAQQEENKPSTDRTSSEVQGMVLIPAGEFPMGSKEGEGDKDEHPQHTVYLSGYYIDKYEVTNEQYYQFWLADGGEKSKHTPASYGNAYSIGDWPEVAKTKSNYPVVGVSWFDAQAYCEWAKKRLPTEAEWEKAARGADGRTWPWGNDFNENINDKNKHSNRWDGDDGYDNTIAPVGSYPTGVSTYGVYDMAGNVWEWVADWYDKDYYSKSLQDNPKGSDKGKLRVVRGGSWRNREYTQKCANRYYCYPDIWGNTLGFRCVRDVP